MTEDTLSKWMLDKPWEEVFPHPAFRPYQREVLDRAIEAWHKKGKKYVIVEAPTGCHAKGTEILMYGGSIKRAEDINVGDCLMGPDSQPRIVLELHRGRQEMAKIVPVKGDPFIVNLDHILSLQRTRTRHEKRCGRTSKPLQPMYTRCDFRGFNPVINITVRDWLTKSNTFKHTYKLYRTGVEFIKTETKHLIPPYILGVWLGDGKVLNNLKGLDLIENKHIPSSYLLASVSDRFELLAGLLDTDGHLGYRGCFEFVQKSRRLAEQVVFLARSLGFAAYLKECQKSSQNGTIGTYHRISISGDIEDIPTRIERKKAQKRQQKKKVLRTGFSVELLPEDEYFGFIVDQDHLYLMGDFTVTHNSGKSSLALALSRKAGSAYLTVSQRMLQDQYVKDAVKTSLADVYEYKSFPQDNEKEAWSAKVKATSLKELQGRWKAAREDSAREIFRELQEKVYPTNPWDVTVLKGKSNYHCCRFGSPTEPQFTCADAPCVKGGSPGERGSESPQAKERLALRIECVEAGICPYYRERLKATVCNTTLTNFSNQLLLSKFKVFGQRNLLVIDEAHLLEQTLFSFVAVDITPRILAPIRHLLNIENQERLEKGITDPKELIELIKTKILPAAKRYLQAQDELETLADIVDEASEDEDGYDIVKLVFKLKLFLELAESTELILAPHMGKFRGEKKEVQRGYRLKPLDVSHLYPMPFMSGEKILLMSATILDHVSYCKTLGIPIKEVEFIQVPSVFPKDNHPFVFRPIGGMGRRDIKDTLPKMVEEINSIISLYKNKKGLIHTVNFNPITANLAEAFKDDPRFLFHLSDGTASKFDLIKRHITSKEPTILVGPGFGEGLDLKDDLCRFIIFTKVPFLNLGDEVIRRKMELDEAWYQWKTALALVQGDGRGMRSETDYCITYMLDENFHSFWCAHKGILPKHFKRRVILDKK